MKLLTVITLVLTFALCVSCETTNSGGSTGTTISQQVIASAEQIALDYFNNWINHAGGKRHSTASKQTAMTRAKVAIRQRYPEIPPAKADEIVSQTFSQ